MNIVCSFIKRVKKFFYYERVLLYGYDLTVHHKFEAVANMKLCRATLKDIEQLYHDELNTGLTNIKWDIWKEKISKGLWKGFICKDGDKIVAHAFYSIEDIFFGGTKWVVLELPPHCAYGFKLYSKPEYRGRKLGQAITAFKWKNAKEEGLRKSFGAILSKNKAAIHIEEKFGGYLIGSIIFLSCRYFNKAILSLGVLRAGLRIKEISDI